MRAKQDQLGDKEHARVLPLLLHGDAAFAGQGIVAETMHLSAPPRLPHRRHDPRGGQQPDRLHDAARGRAQLHLRDRRRQDGPRAGTARERRRPRGGRLRREPRARVPPEVQEGRGDRPRLLPALGPQRDRRAELHAADHVRPHQEPPLGGEPVRRQARARGHGHARGARRALGREEGRDAVRGRRGQDALRGHRPPRGSAHRHPWTPRRCGDGSSRRSRRSAPCRTGSRSTRSCCRSSASGRSCWKARARSTGRRPRRSASGRCCSRACRCGSRARTRGAAPSRSATRCFTT